MVWKLKQFFRKILPFLVIGGIAYGGWNLYKSASRHGRPSFVHLLQKIPYFGSRFRHYGGSSQAYRNGGPSYRRAHGRTTHRRHHGRRHRRHR